MVVYQRIQVVGKWVSAPIRGVHVPAMRKTIATVFTRVTGGTDVLYECRDCGTNLEADAASCSTCGSTAVAVYEFSNEE